MEYWFVAVRAAGDLLAFLAALITLVAVRRERRR